MIGKRITLFAFIFSLVVIAASVFFRIRESYTLSNVLLAASIVLFLIFSWIQRRIKEDMLPFLPDEYREREWRYYFSSLFSFILLIFTTTINSFIVFLGMGISRVLIDILLGAVILLMLYTVFSVPTVEKTAAYPIFLLFALVFAVIVIASQMDIGYHLPENASPILIKMADPLFLLNIALVSWMASLMAGGEMPSPIASVTGLYERGRAVKEEVLYRRNWFYLSVVGLIVAFILINIFTIIKLPGGATLSSVQWGYALIFLSIAILVAIIFYIIFILPERTGTIKEKYDVETLYRILVLASSAIFAALFIILAVLVQLEKIRSIGSIPLTKDNAIDFAIFAILSSIGPFGFYEASRYRKMNLIEERFPEFLRDLAESRKAGMTMARAVEMAARGDYGYLTPYIRKMAVQISWGLPFSEALKRFGDAINTPLVQRTTTMVVKASEAGGKVADVIEAAAKNVREIKILQAERRTEMKMYLMIIYVSFFVFLSVIMALSSMFLPKLYEAAQSAGGLIGGSAGLTLKEYNFIYISTAISQAIGSGIVAGALSEGKMLAGLRHGTIMIIVTYIVFKLLA
ncbi:MAG: type II secretion system F family protein [Thermoplasmata archaeon]|nr:type II secretion system F family protein [Thermoplasmata archaeon]